MARKKPKYPRTLKFLRQFKKDLVEEMKKNLEKNKASGTLSESIKASRTSIKDDNINWYIETEDYAKFVDKGVKGADPGGIYKNNPNKTGVQRAPGSPYSFKTKMPPTNASRQRSPTPHFSIHVSLVFAPYFSTQAFMCSCCSAVESNLLAHQAHGRFSTMRNSPDSVTSNSNLLNLRIECSLSAQVRRKQRSLPPRGTS